MENTSEKLNKRERELSILNTIARELSSHNNLEYSLNTALQKVSELLNLDTGWIFLTNEKGDINLAASLNLPPALENNKKAMSGSCYCLQMFEAGNLKSAENINVITCSRLYGLVDGTKGLRFHASIPLYTDNKKMGVLNVASTNWKELSGDDLKILYTIGDLLAIAIERATLFEKSVEYAAVEERFRLARELHDTLGQSMTSVILRLETAEALIEAEADKEKIKKTISQTLNLARSNLDEARRSILNLRASTLDHNKLEEAITLLADEIQKNNNIEINFSSEMKNINLSPFIEASLYRLVQESLSNIVKHSKALNVCIELKVEDNNIFLSVKDDGIGFEQSKIPKERYGLIGLNERVKLLNGELKIETEVDKGTYLQFLIPVSSL